MKKKLTTIAASSLLILGLAACSDDTTNEESAISTGVEETETQEEVGPEEETEVGESEKPEQELDEAEAQKGAAQKLNDYYDTLFSDNSEAFGESAIFPQEEAPTVEELVEFGENEASVLMGHFYFDEDFTDNEKAALVVSGVAANLMASTFSAEWEQENIKFTILPEEIEVDGNRAEVEPGDLEWSVDGEVVDMGDANMAMASSSHLIYIDGQWHMDARATLNESLALSGEAKVEDLLTEMGVEPVNMQPAEPSSDEAGFSV